MTKEYVDYRIEQHNAMVNNFMTGELKQRLKVKNDKINMEQWFLAQDMIKEQRFFERGRMCQSELRGQGFDVKMNMQNNTLILE